ncbi:TPA: hypothetical protein RQ837_003568 [Pseudomonas aeruginosa]|nr:hypothetical protein [Pseudomonas aeruginosa]MBR7846586.1 hypothetical protein [Pseudomonas aeruginosa]MBR7859847.1 hypothetical protein [Pseudomonas aeruginosa]MBR7866538.1 hypothetical protein [Pseudomonas aeruginosa]MBX5984901.1 hypothetical protein [Pseudomonas aeruginosa]MBX6635867.1 hypothetical protein [Pseudomonas aeruginosa]
MLVETRKSVMLTLMLLAMFLAWAGHAITSISGQQQTVTSVENVNKHIHAGEGMEQTFEAIYVDHGHEHSTPDHLHETPYLASKVRMPPQPSASERLAAAPCHLPIAPVALIERPPRHVERS